MLTPLQALLSAVLTGLIVQYLSVKYGFPEELEIINVKELRTIDRSVPITLQLSTCLPDEEPSVEVNKVLDAIFVTHGIETEIEKHLNSELVPKTLNESNFSSIYSGNWLILA